MNRSLKSLILVSFCLAGGAVGAAPAETSATTVLPHYCSSEGFHVLENAADAGDAEAQYRYAMVLERGLCGKRDPVRAFALLTNAGLKGHAKSAVLVAHLYSEGTALPRDPEQANRFYRIAAKQGDVEAQHSLGVSLLREAGSDEDVSEAVHWLTEAAEEGHGLSAASLGLLYWKGMKGLETNICLAIEWFMRASALGFKDLDRQTAPLIQSHKNIC